MPRSSYSTPAVVDVVIYRTLPSNPRLGIDPVLKVFGELDVRFSSTVGSHDPVYFQAVLGISEESPPQVAEFKPLYGMISGVARVFLDAYRELFEDAIRRNPRLLGLS